MSDSVGDRIRTQVTLHALAEQLDDRPWARERAEEIVCCVADRLGSDHLRRWP
jgi:hypothetical protein